MVIILNVSLHLITSSIISKPSSGGWRLGTAVIPEALSGKFKDTLLGIASETYSCATLPVQLAACEAFKLTEATEEFVAQQRRILTALGNECATRLLRHGIRVHRPEGGFYLFLDFNNFRDAYFTSHDLCEALLAETGVALLPGHAFGMEPGHLSARLAYVDFDGVAALEAARKTGDVSQPLDVAFLSANCAHLLEGIQKLCEWAVVISWAR